MFLYLNTNSERTTNISAVQTRNGTTAREKGAIKINLGFSFPLLAIFKVCPVSGSHWSLRGVAGHGPSWVGRFPVLFFRALVSCLGW